MPLLLAALGVLAAAPAGAQQQGATEVEERLTLLVPGGAGGGTDAVARRLALLLNEPLGVPVDVVNRPGAGGAEALEALRRAEPDGLTLGILTGAALRAAGAAGITPLLLFNLDPPALHLAPGVEPERRIEAVIGGRAAASGAPAGSLAHLALAHLAAERGRVLPRAGWLPAADPDAALRALAGGAVEAVVASAAEAAGPRRAGEVVTLAGEGEGPAAGLPRTLGGWRGLAAPKGLSRRRAEAIVEAARSATARDGFREFLVIRGYTPADLGPADFARFLDRFGAELERAAAAID